MAATSHEGRKAIEGGESVEEGRSSTTKILVLFLCVGDLGRRTCRRETVGCERL